MGIEGIPLAKIREYSQSSEQQSAYVTQDGDFWRGEELIGHSWFSFRDGRFYAYDLQHCRNLGGFDSAVDARVALARSLDDLPENSVFTHGGPHS